MDIENQIIIDKKVKSTKIDWNQFNDDHFYPELAKLYCFRLTYYSKLDMKYGLKRLYHAVTKFKSSFRNEIEILHDEIK